MDAETLKARCEDAIKKIDWDLVARVFPVRSDMATDLVSAQIEKALEG